ncbi:MAG: FAD-dependent oxidoreductase, partial [Oscillospiraceae bacterium]|nr:FAD-dependent oxidoreductase [Oscillospiraceae bacterium]
MPRCFNVHYARKVKERYPDLLVNTVGSIVSIDYAEEIIANGWADFVAMCRPLMADPDMPRKYAENRPEDRRPCLRCDTCTKHLMIPKPIYCAVNPFSGMTSELKDGLVPKAPVKKKVAVVGGGPAGITALQTLCERGHDVTLYEMSDHLGGYVYEASVAPFKVDMKDYLAWLRRQAAKCVKDYGAKVLLNTKADANVLEVEGYEAVIIANGSTPIIPKRIPGIDKPHVHWTPEAEIDNSLLGDKIVIVGAGSVGLEAAIEFVDMGKQVDVVEMADVDAAMNKLHEAAATAASEFIKQINEKPIPVHYATKLVEVTDTSVICEDTATGNKIEYPCDTVLLAMGMASRTAEAEAMRHVCAETSIFVVGDAKKVGTIGTAVNEAFRACLHI